MDGYFVGMHRDLRVRKALLSTSSSAEFNTTSLNSKLYKVVSYIQYNKAWERIYVLLKIIFPCLWFLHLSDIKISVMYKLLYYARMTKISIIKSSSDLDKKYLFPVSSS